MKLVTASVAQKTRSQLDIQIGQCDMSDAKGKNRRQHGIWGVYDD
jgi:hypothetical protein